MKTITVVPELNLWVNKALKNSPLTDSFHKIPTVLSDYWREPNSIIELLFNETFTPTNDSIPPQERDVKYIYEYRKCNLLFITDKKLLARIQPYRWNAFIYAANSEKFDQFFNMQGSSNNIESESQIRLPFDVSEADRAPNVTYKSKTLFTSTYQLVETDKNLIINEPPPHPIFPPVEDLFMLTDKDFEMLNLLYEFKTNIPVTLTSIRYDTLTELSKMIYVYLDVLINGNYLSYSGSEFSSSGNNILASLYEKHLINMIYDLQAKQYGVIYNEKEIINNKQESINVDEFMIMKKKNVRVILNNLQVQTKEILISEDIPWDKKDFELFKDGVLLQADKDYTMVINFSDPNNIVAKVTFITPTLILGESILMIWSYVSPYSISTIDE